MAGNFWEAQKRARSRTTLYLFLFVCMTLFMAYCVEIASRYFLEGYQDSSMPWMGILFSGATFMIAAFQYMQFLVQGGSYVAKSLGARLVSRDTQQPREQQLLNIVEEMAVAASLPVPPVYLLPSEQINAFAAGITPHDAAITVTAGALNALSRDELQGVIAHEFGHVYNGDVKISMRLAAMVMAFFFLLYMGLRLLNMSSYRQDNGGNGRGVNIVMMMALILALSGASTWLFGSILKSAVSREREYLADACAVQFTRNPEGLIGALHKISQQHISDMPSYGMAFSHLYFDDGTPFSALFATHPPIKKRIAAILGRDYTPEEWNKK